MNYEIEFKMIEIKDLSKIQKYRNICPVCMQLVQVQGHLKLR